MRSLVFAGFMLFAALLPAEVYAQNLRGHVVDSANDGPVAEATVRVLGPRGIVAGPATTDSAGAFEFAVRPSPGLRIEVERIGYPRSTSTPFELAEGEVLELAFRLDAQAIALEPLTILARSGGMLGRDQFARRCAGGTGTCLDPIHVALLEPVFPTELFYEVPGLVVDPMLGGAVRRLTGGGCLVTFLNNQIDAFAKSAPPRRRAPPVGAVLLSGSARLLPESRTRQAMATTIRTNRLDTEIAANTVRGVEIYPTAGDVPDEIMRGMRGFELDGGILGRCGVIVIWTDDAW